MATYLDRILTAHRASAAARPADLARLRDQAAAAPPVRPFAAALRAAPGLAVIAEVKRRSPSKGDLAPDLDPAGLAAAYEAAGAVCLSVLTDVEFFGGSGADLAVARAACALPVLRKDFTVVEADVWEARCLGADAVLLIVAALTQEELGRFHAAAAEAGLDALVEVHDDAEVERALAVGATLIGVNQRDLVTFEVDTSRAVRVAAAIPDTVLKVAESGVHDRQAAARLHEAGYDAVLVGEALVTAPDVGARLRELAGTA